MTQPALKTQTSNLDPQSGLKFEQRRSVADALSMAVSDTYRLFIMTQGVHWNVQGPLFYSVHKLTEDQYRDMFEAIDDLAERIRALGFPAPQTVEALTRTSDLTEPAPGAELKAQIETLVAANESIAERMRPAVHAAEEKDDVKSADLLTDRIGVHEENAWMLRAMIAS